MALEMIGTSLNLGEIGNGGPRAKVSAAETRNELPVGPWGVPDGVDCPECHNGGIITVRDEKGNLWGRECKCMARRRSNLMLERSGLKDMLNRYTFDSFQSREKWQRDAKQAAQRYAENPADWFLTAGASGTGKTHLCTAICGKLIESGIETRYLLWRDMAARAKATVGKDEGGYTSIVEPLKKVRALYIDDLFKVGRERDRYTGEWRQMTPTAGDISLAFEIINARYCDRSKLTIISTELSFPELMDVDEALGSRIYERCKAGGLLRMENRKNWRLGEA